MLHDIQNEEDKRGKKLYKVGVSGIKVPVSIIQSRDKTPTPTTARVSIYTDLDKKFRGANMSRLSEILHESLSGHIGSEVIITMLKELRKRMNSKNSYVKFSFDYFMQKRSPISKKLSYMVYSCDLEGKSKEGDDKLYLTVRVPYTSLCPCSKAISKVGAHNQRSEAKVTVELKNKFLDIREVIKMVESHVSCPIFATLKRIDEKYVTEKAYNNPKFVEDMARDLALAFDKWLDKKIEDYLIVITHFESIHAHDAVAIISAGRNIC